MHAKHVLKPAARNLPSNVKLLGWVSFWNDVASEMIYPLAPKFFISVLGGDRVWLGAVEGLAETLSSLLKLGSGRWSDQAQRRRPFVLFGYLVAAAARPVLGLVTAPWHLLVLRSIDRAGKGLRTTPRDAMIAESTDAAQRGQAFGFHRAMDHAGAAVGPLVATAFLFVFPGQLRWLFLSSLIPGLIVAGILLVGLRETWSTNIQQEAQASPRSRLPTPLRRLLPVLFVFALGNSADAFLLVRAEEVGIATGWLPLLWLAFHVAKSVGNYWAGHLVDRRGATGPLLVGWIVYAAVYFAFGLASQPWQIVLLFLGYAWFYALSEPAEKTLIVQTAAEFPKGTALGWFHFVSGIAALPSSLIFGAIYEHWGPQFAFGWGAGCAALATAMLVGWRWSVIAVRE